MIRVEKYQGLTQKTGSLLSPSKETHHGPSSLSPQTRTHAG